MLSNFLQSILREPVSGDILHYDADKNILVANLSGKTYSIIQEVPHFVKAEKKSSIASKAAEGFDPIEHYNKDASNNDYFEKESYGPTREQRRRNRQTILNSINRSRSVILDIGSGSSWVAKHFSSTDYTVISMDVASANAIIAKQLIARINHEAVVASGEALPFADNTFDFIIASEVIEHLVDPKKVIAHWMTKLVAGGQLIMVTPFDEKIIFHTCIHCNNLTPADAHLHSFNKENIKNYLPEKLQKCELRTISNKYAIKTKLYYFLRFLPYELWSSLDKTLNFLIKKPTLFFIKLTKK